MNNNDIMRRLRYALDIKNTDMIEIFNLGGIKVSKDELLRILLNPKKDSNTDENEDGLIEDKDMMECNNHMLESFLNGFIIFKRGKQDTNSSDSNKNEFMITNDKSVNNVMLKKLKIALTLTSEEMLDIFKLSDTILSNGELSALLRREGHRNYRPCGDRYARKFLNGLTLKYRT